MNRLHTHYITAFIICMCACKKVITVNLKNAIPQIVIQGNITNETGPYTIKITKTVTYTSDNIFPPVTGAAVSIKDNTINTTDALIETAPGIYSTSILQGVQGHTYTLTVTAEKKTYTASSTMPQQILLDGVSFLKINAFGATIINAVPKFQDPPGIPNYYKFEQTLNKRKLKQFFTFDDRLSDSRYATRQLFNDSAYLNIEDTLLLEMQCIDKNIFNYFDELDRITNPNNSQSSTPTNPTSNINNNALGYFSAHTVQRKKVVVKL